MNETRSYLLIQGGEFGEGPLDAMAMAMVRRAPQRCERALETIGFLFSREDVAQFWLRIQASRILGFKGNEAAFVEEEKMEEPDVKFDTLLNHLKELSRYYTGHPRQQQCSRVLEFKSERQFVELLHQGEPVAVAFTLKCPWTQRFDRVLEDAAAESYPHIKFVRVECPKYPGFCIARQRKDYPFVEIFHSPKPSQTQEGVKDRAISRFSVNVTPYNYDMSAYGFREFFKRHKTLFQPEDI